MGDVYYDQISSGYDELHGQEQLRKAEIILQSLEIKPSDVLLDVGCGTARSLSVFGCRKFGIDPAFELLKQAEIPVVQGFAERLPFSANSFDVVLSLTAIHNFDDVQQAINEMLRVSRRDVVISVLRKTRNFKEIEQIITAVLSPSKRVEEQHDVVFFGRKQF